jgi:hypothetical protein
MLLFNPETIRTVPVPVLGKILKFDALETIRYLYSDNFLIPAPLWANRVLVPTLPGVRVQQKNECGSVTRKF